MSILEDVIRSTIGGGSSPGQGRSPIMMALLALLASRAMSGRGAGAQAPQAGDLGGLRELIDRFRQGGLQDVIGSWIGTGPNKPIAPNQLHDALGAETVDDLSRQTGMARDDLLSELSRLLPGVVDKLTPNGQLPADQDLLPGPR
jgi:uncharacterized protein YidB (DUF937 family)